MGAKYQFHGGRASSRLCAEGGYSGVAQCTALLFVAEEKPAKGEEEVCQAACGAAYAVEIIQPALRCREDMSRDRLGNSSLPGAMWLLSMDIGSLS